MEYGSTPYVGLTRKRTSSLSTWKTKLKSGYMKLNYFPTLPKVNHMQYSVPSCMAYLQNGTTSAEQ